TPLKAPVSVPSLDQISQITVTPASTPGHPAGPVTVGQLGTVQLVSVPADTITRTDGQPSIGLQVSKGPNSNTVTVANEVKTALPAIESSVGHGVHVRSVSDQAT